MTDMIDMTNVSRHDQALGAMLAPRSIAILGASEQLSKINGRPLKFLLEMGYTGNIYPVNPKYPQIAGLICYPDVDSLPAIPDLAIIALPANNVCSAIEALGQKGVRAAVVFSSGFGEMGASGKEREAVLLATARASGVLICGPNCLGLINAFDKVYATFSQYADGDTAPGPVGFVTQSGAFGTAIAALARRRGLGLGYFVNTGNEVDAGFADIMSKVVDDPRIKVAAGYLEGVKDGPGLVALAELCMQLDKPLVLTKVGRLGAGARAAASHTGSLAIEDLLFDSVARQCGIVRARNEEQMLDILEAFVYCAPPAGAGLGIVTQSGGAAVMMADRAEEVGLTVPRLNADTEARLSRIVPGFGACGNPVDVTGQFVAEPAILRDSVLTMLADPGIDIGIIWLQLMAAHIDLLVNLFIDLKKRSAKPFIVCWVAAPEEAILGLHAAGIAVLRGAEPAVEAVAALVRHAAARRAWLAEKAKPALKPFTLPAPLLNDLPPVGVVDTLQAVQLLTAAGVPMAKVELATSEDDAVAAWRRFGGAVALKIESPDITHKTEAGGVRLNLNDEAAVRQCYRAIRQSARNYDAQARLAGVIVQLMASGCIELVIGVKRDPTFGMMVMVGMGGILVEVLRDVAWRQAPFSQNEALLMLDELRMRAVFDGVRGRPAIDKQVLASLLSSLSLFADAMKDCLLELDLNPVLIGENGAVAVDCVMVLLGQRHSAAA
ncbi:CoA binding domain protein [mine drainage metagenome]|uniref:CoA binding domain protein n=1 Tax=mine drainage metagenome TaxID=410659 RepID=A0A1J5R8K1_9ZZZZ